MIISNQKRMAAQILSKKEGREVGVHRVWINPDYLDEVSTPETRRQIFTAVIIRQSRPFRRVDGTWARFEDNACVLTNERGDVQGSDIKGPVSREAAERWPRIAATAKQIV